MNVTFTTSGDTNLLVEFNQQVNLQTSRQVQALVRWLEQEGIPGVTEWAFGYSTVLIEYNPCILGESQLCSILTTALEEMFEDIDNAKNHAEMQDNSSRCVVIPVCYGIHDKQLGPDLETVARINELRQEEVIRLHSSVDYYVYFTGFLPSFPFLGGMSPSIVTPRLRQPRTRVPAGSVGIAGEQTGIYPVDSPGGWQLIGRTPVRLFDLRRENPFVVKAGDWIRFEPISVPEYADLVSQDELSPLFIRINP